MYLLVLGIVRVIILEIQSVIINLAYCLNSNKKC